MKNILASLTFLVLFLILNFVVINSTSIARQNAAEWKVTCHYDGYGVLTGYDCFSGGNHICGGCPM